MHAFFVEIFLRGTSGTERQCGGRYSDNGHDLPCAQPTKRYAPIFQTRAPQVAGCRRSRKAGGADALSHSWSNTGIGADAPAVDTASSLLPAEVKLLVDV